jgi:hypothetical protein
MKTAYYREKFKFYLKNIHKQPLADIVLKFKNWGKSYYDTVKFNGRPYKKD